jgi:hypothetical protein
MRCTSPAVLRHPRDSGPEELRGQPILDDDGKRQYVPCKAWARKGQTVCGAHGGNTPANLKRAEDQLKAARDPLMAALLTMALDERKSPAERLKAITWALERTGFRGGMEINVDMPGWQKMLEQEYGRTIDGELTDKQPANAEPLTREDIMRLNVGERFEAEPKPAPGGDYVNSSDELPIKWREPLSRNGRVSRS